jgi:RNA polymerase sigma-70 factor (ECF subfamily)
MGINAMAGAYTHQVQAEVADMRSELVRLGGGAHALAIQILGNTHDAQDAVHDAFETVLDKPGAYDARKGPLKPWFLRVVRNRCIDMLRRRHASTTMPVDELESAVKTPEEALEAGQVSSRLERALASISASRREIIILRDYLDLSYAEIASVLGIAPGTVMSRLHRARLALKEALDTDVI